LKIIENNSAILPDILLKACFMFFPRFSPYQLLEINKAILMPKSKLIKKITKITVSYEYYSFTVPQLNREKSAVSSIR